MRRCLRHRAIAAKKCVWQSKSQVKAIIETGALVDGTMTHDFSKNDYKVGFKVRKNRLLCWLIVLLSILLAVAIGMFVFLSLNAKYHFACVMGCEQPEDPAAHGQLRATVATSVTAATQRSFSIKTSALEIRKSEKPTQKQAVSTKRTTTVIKIDRDTIIRSRTPIIRSSTPSTSASTNSVSGNVNKTETKSRSHGKFTTARRVTTPANTLNLRSSAKPRRLNNYINISGKIVFQSKAPKRLPRNSHLTVEFEDVSRMDAASILLAKTVVDLSQYRRGRPLFYTIICKRPELAHAFYSISAVLNVGWKQRDKIDEWIRKGDFFNDMFLRIHIKKGKSVYERNIQLIKY